MQKNELHKLGKTDLLTIIYEQGKQIEQLENEIKNLNKQLEDRTIKIKEAGSIADASLKINKIFEAAQQAADEYLRSIKEVNKISQENAEMVRDITNDKVTEDTYLLEQETPTEHIEKTHFSEKNDEINTTKIYKMDALVPVNKNIAIITPKLLKRIAIFLIQLKEKLKMLVTTFHAMFIFKRKKIQNVFKQKSQKNLNSKEEKNKNKSIKNQKISKEKKQNQKNKNQKISKEKKQNQKKKNPKNLKEKKSKSKKLPKDKKESNIISLKKISILDILKRHFYILKSKCRLKKAPRESLQKNTLALKKVSMIDIFKRIYYKVKSKWQMHFRSTPRIIIKENVLVLKKISIKDVLKRTWYKIKNKCKIHFRKEPKKSPKENKLVLKKISIMDVLKRILYKVKNKCKNTFKKAQNFFKNNTKKLQKNLFFLKKCDKITMQMAEKKLLFCKKIKNMKNTIFAKKKVVPIVKKQNVLEQKVINDKEKNFFANKLFKKKKIDVNAIKISLNDLEKELKLRKEKANQAKFARTIAFSGVVIIAFTIIAATRIFNVLEVSGNSMEPSLYSGDLLISTKILGYKKGDMIAFYYNNSVLIKRIIATEGDMVYIDDEGNVYVNSKKIEEKYVQKLAYGNCDITFPYRVPEKEVFVLGDNRENSIDSRSKAIGSISEEKILGKITMNIKQFLFY